MTTQNLLEGLKTLLETEFKKSGIKLTSKEGEYIVPNVYIGFLPTTVNERDFPFVVIVPPADAVDDEENNLLTITVVTGVKHADIGQEPVAFADILTLTERTKEILMQNNALGAFARTGKVSWGVDAMAGVSVDISLGEIEVTYKTRSSYRGLR